MGTHTRDGPCLHRRSLLATVALGSVGLLAGCLGDEDVPEPVALDEGQACDNCDMQIDMHPGPAGQAFYPDDQPAALPDDREDGVAWFCSTRCTYAFTFDQEDHDYDPAVMYATDYSGVDFELATDGDATAISSHLAAGAFEALEELTLVVDSDVEGAMGASLIGFADESDAAEFEATHGGDLFEHDEITPDVIAALGM